MAKNAAKNAGGKRKWVRQVIKKGIPLSAKKQKSRPYLEIIGHSDGTAVAFATQIDKKGDPREYYSGPICSKIEEDADCREETGLSDVMYRRGICGARLPQSSSSQFVSGGDVVWWPPVATGSTVRNTESDSRDVEPHG